MTAVPFLATSLPLLAEWFAPLSAAEQLRETPLLVQTVLELCLAAAYLALWQSAKDFRAFRTLGVFFILVAIQQTSIYFGYQLPVWSMRAIAAGFLVEAAADAMRVQHRRWTLIFWPFYLYASVAVWFLKSGSLSDWSVYVSEIPLLILVFEGLRRSNARDRSIAAAFLIYMPIRITLTPFGQQLLHAKEGFTIAGWHWWYSTTSISVLGIVTLVIFVRDLIHDRAEKQRLSAELAASRAVQQVLIPEEIPTVPGFELRAVYRPYGEVGGDFFQILPQRDGGVLIAIGDVSGKGMPAAMLVSFLVGALHALSRTCTRPAELLSGLNESVRRRSSGGFTTCLILLIGADGKLAFANAGHISPYRNGEELATEGGLPLGLVAESNYAESRLQLFEGDQITLLTDGVVEARNTAGELFGFERTAAISAEPAELIATQAQEFGQDDDITVLTVRYLLNLQGNHATDNVSSTV